MPQPKTDPEIRLPSSRDMHSLDALAPSFARPSAEELAIMDLRPGQTAVLSGGERVTTVSGAGFIVEGPGIRFQGADLGWYDAASRSEFPIGTVLRLASGVMFPLPCTIHETHPAHYSRVERLHLDREIAVVGGDYSARVIEMLYGTVAACCEIGQGNRSSNQDGFLVLNTSYARSRIWLGDGMGGEGYGEFAIRAALRSLGYSSILGASLEESIDLAGPAMLRLARDEGFDLGSEGTGLCVVGADIARSDYGLIHLGDARAEHHRPSPNEVEEIHRTAGHSYREILGKALAEGRIDEATYLRSMSKLRGRNAVTRCLQVRDGDVVDSAPTVSARIPLRCGDVLLFTTDGAWANLARSEVWGAVRQYSNMEQLVRVLRDIVRDGARGGGEDDNLVILAYRHEVDS